MSHGDFSVNDLSIDCLTEILSFLSLKEQLRCGAVCRRWRPIVPICPKGKRHLEVARLPFARGHLFYGNFSNSECVESALKSILPKLSPAVKSISLADCNLSNEQFDLITCSCRNLEKLTLGIPSKFQLNFDLQRF